MKKQLSRFITLFITMIFALTLFACDNSKPTPQFQRYSNYIEVHGISKTLYYHNLHDNYFGDFSINVSTLEHVICFFFFPSDNVRNLSVFIHDSDPAIIDVTYSLGKLTVFMTYTDLYSSKSCEVGSVEVGGVEESKSSYFYADSVEKAQKAVEQAVPWMTTIVKKSGHNTYSIHSLYNH